MFEKYLINLGFLTENELDFHDWCLENYQQLIDLQLGQIAKMYGVGVSFIYKFFARMNFKGLKEFLFYLGYTSSLKNKMSFFNYSNQLNCESIGRLMAISNFQTFNLLTQQEKLLVSFIEDIHNHHKIFLIGFGYSFLAIQDFIGFYRFLDNSLTTINDNEPHYLDKFDEINDKSLIIIYSARAINRKINAWVNKIKAKNPNVLIYLITANPKNPIANKIDYMIEVDSLLKRIDGLKEETILSPISNFISFNNIVKTMYFSKYRKEVLQYTYFKDEIESWHDDKLAK